MSAVVIRTLIPADADLLLQSAVDVFDAPPIEEQTLAFLASPDHRIVAAIAAGQIVAFASGVRMLHPDKQPVFFVNEVSTREDCQRQGLATKVTSALLDEARAMGCQDIWLATESDNEAARGLYRKLKARESDGIVVFDWGGVMDA